MPILDSLSAQERELFVLAHETRERQKKLAGSERVSDKRQKVKGSVGRPPKHDVAAILNRFWLYSWGQGPIDIKAFCIQEGLSERTFRYMRKKWEQRT